MWQPHHPVTDPPLLGEDIEELGVLKRGDVLCVQKLEGVCIRSVLSAARRLGVVTIYIDSDLPCKVLESKLAHITVCSSRWLAEQYRLAGVESCYIPDAIEDSRPPSLRPSKADRLTCGWFGRGTTDKWPQAVHLAEFLSNHCPKWRLLTVSDHPRADVKWELDTVGEVLGSCHAVALPAHDHPVCFAKSANRAIQAMAFGVPVLAYPIPAYREVIRSGRNGYLCDSDVSWRVAFESLEDSDRRRRIASLGYRFARRHFSVANIGRMWHSLLLRLVRFDSVPLPVGDETEHWRIFRLQERMFRRMAVSLASAVALERAYSRSGDQAASYALSSICSGNQSVTPLDSFEEFVSRASSQANPH